RDWSVTGVQTCALPILAAAKEAEETRKAADAESKKAGEKIKIAALPRPESQQGTARFDGSWQFHRISANCGDKSWYFTLRIANRSEERRVGKEGGARWE